jgi:hypothetical protein
MDTTTILIILGIIVLLAALFMRNRVAPRGTYDDPNARSSGSIGGGARAYEDPDVRSGGSFGGGPRAYDDPAATNSGTFGGSSGGGNTANPDTYDEPGVRSGGAFGGTEINQAGVPIGGKASNPTPDREKDPNRPRHDDEDFKSKGSIGG